MAAKATFALKAGVWFRRGRLVISLLIRWAQRARCQAETPLIVLSKFPEPALSLLLLFVRRLLKSPSRSEAAAGMVLTAAPQRNEKRSEGFNMQTEIAKLAERIVEPVTAKLTMQELGNVVGQIKHAFEQLNTPSIAADTDLANMAFTILRPIQPMLSEAEFARV